MGNEDAAREQALQAMDFVIQGLQTGMWGIVSGYIEHAPVAANVMEGSVRLYLHALCVYHGHEVGAQYAKRMIEMLEPFAAQQVEVTEENWFQSMTPPLLEQLG